MTDYPPGVSGNEYAIAGPDYERSPGPSCPRCEGVTTVEEGWRGGRWLTCDECGETTELGEETGEDPDDARDRRMDFERDDA